MDTQGHVPPKDAPDPQLNRIVSVNNRGGSGASLVGKVIFCTAVVAVVTIGGLVTFKKLSGDASVLKTQNSLAAKSENKPATVQSRRLFETEQAPPLPDAASLNSREDIKPIGEGLCTDGKPAILARTSAGQPITGAQGQTINVCDDGRIIVPALDTTANAPPIPVAGGSPRAAQSTTTQTSAVHANRYAGDVILSGGGPDRAAGADAGDPMTNPFIRMALGQGNGGPQQANQSVQAATSGPVGSVGSMLQPSVAQAVRAGKIGDRNMILPMGRSIECGLSVRILSDLAGLTSCVLTQNVYSDNGRVVLLERGSEATGEYRSVSERGQRRLFVIWTRIKTPNGILINLDSPGSDSLGTTGLSGRVDNHWWQRVGGAFLLSTIKDAIAYQTADAAPGNSGGGILYQNTATAGDRIAEKVLDSTINIRPTIYKSQGDRGSIYVARDLDFGSVYALRAQ